MGVYSHNMNLLALNRNAIYQQRRRTLLARRPDLVQRNSEKYALDLSDPEWEYRFIYGIKKIPRHPDGKTAMYERAGVLHELKSYQFPHYTTVCGRSAIKGDAIFYSHEPLTCRACLFPYSPELWNPTTPGVTAADMEMK